MAVRNVLRMGNPVLRAPNRVLQKAELQEPWFIQLLVDMYETMKATQGIGLAAPQIGENLQLAIIDMDADEDDSPKKKAKKITYQEILAHPTLKVFVNPVIKVLDPSLQKFWEGCLSVPGLQGLVARPRHVQVEFMNTKGSKQVLEFLDFESTVVQHELDHLNAVLYVDRLVDSKSFAFSEEFRQFILPTAKEGVLEEDSGE